MKTLEDLILASLNDRIPKEFRKLREYRPTLDIWKEYAAGTTPISVLSFAPNLQQVVTWLTAWLIKLSMKSTSWRVFQMQKDLRRLNFFYASLDDGERGEVKGLVDMQKVVYRIYEASRVCYPRNIRLQAQMLLDQVAWQHQHGEKSTTMATIKSALTELYPPDDQSVEFQFSRLDYLMTTVGGETVVQTLSSQPGALSSLLRQMVEHLKNESYVTEFRLRKYLFLLIYLLPPEETLELLKIHHQLPSVLERDVYQHLYNRLTNMKRPRRFYKIVSRTMGQLSFMYHVLDPGLLPLSTEENENKIATRDLSARICARLKDLNYPFLRRRECQRLMRRHPANGASLLSFVDHFHLNGHSEMTQFRYVIPKILRLLEFTEEIVTALSDVQHKEYHVARYMCSRFGSMKSETRTAIFHLRLLEHPRLIDLDIRLALFEGLHSAIHNHATEYEYSLKQVCSDIDASIGMENFWKFLCDTVCSNDNESESLVKTCIGNYADQLRVVLIAEAPGKFVERLQCYLVSCQKAGERKAGYTSIQIATLLADSLERCRKRFKL